MDLSLSAILTSSGKDLACIFFITWLRCILTVASLGSSSAAICLLSIAEPTNVRRVQERCVTSCTAGLLRLLSSSTQQKYCPRKHGPLSLFSAIGHPDRLRETRVPALVLKS